MDSRTLDYLLAPAPLMRPSEVDPYLSVAPAPEIWALGRDDAIGSQIGR